MPANPSNTPEFPDDHIDPALAEELARVVDLVRSQVAGGSSSGKSMALLRVIDNLTPEEWQDFAASNGLDRWLAFPLDSELANSVSSLIAAMDHLAFQRDHDALTGVGNRRLFNARMASEFERALRSHAELSLMMLDLDNFKQVNDTYGHACGDTVLQRLAAVLHSSVRPYDTVARIGGEEFAVIFPATSCWTGLRLGNRVLERFRQETFLCKGHSFSISFSAGVSSIAQMEGIPSIERLSASADEALYAAKNQGKNKVVLAESGKQARDKVSLVHSREKQFLFSLGSE